MGRDTWLCRRLRPTRCFNPRARMGRDVSCSSGDYCGCGFNPRARMGRDFPAACRMAVLTCFNPRARMGRDVSVFVELVDHHVSIHAPVWGATCYSALVSRVLQFQSTRPYGARPAAWPPMPGSYSFNPRARMGRDILSAIHTHQFEVSIHAPVWGAT